MHYQVVARPHEQGEAWDYYPYWAPVRDREAAIRLANYAAQDGYEAAILQSVTIEMLRKISHGVVDRQDHELLPALRFLPGAAIATAFGHRTHSVHAEFQFSEGFDPYVDDSVKAELDERRLTMEMGLGGDVTLQAEWRQRMTLPFRMDLLRSWLSLRQRLLQGQVGGALDGASVGA